MVGTVQGKEINLRSKFVSLRSINESDFARLIEWRNNPEINRYLNQPYKLTMELQYKWYVEKYLKSNDILFIIPIKKTKKYYKKDVKYESTPNRFNKPISFN